MSKAKELAREVISMMSDSQGVAGFHMNERHPDLDGLIEMCVQLQEKQ